MKYLNEIKREVGQLGVGKVILTTYRSTGSELTQHLEQSEV